MRVNFFVELLNLTKATGIYSGSMRVANHLKEKGVEVLVNDPGYDYDILHVHTPGPLTLKKMINAKKHGVKVILHAHSTPEDLKGSFTFTGHKLLLELIGKYLVYVQNKADLILTPSNWTKGILIKRGVHVPIIVISNGIDIRKFRYSNRLRREFRKSYNIDKNSIIAYNVGLVYIRKGLITFKEVAQKLPDIGFIWVGRKQPSVFINPIQIANAFRSMPDNAYFLGYVDDIVAAHCGCDVFFFPSYVENQGIVILEAMSCGRPVLVRTLPTYRDWLVNKKNCFEASSTEGFVRYLRKLADDRKLRERFGKRACKDVKRHSFDNTIKQLIGIYEDLLNVA